MGTRGPPPGLAFGAFHLLAQQSSSSSSNSSRSATPPLPTTQHAAPSLAAAAAAAHQRAASSSLSQSVSALDQDQGQDKNQGTRKGAQYSVAFLLAISTSKLVCRPDNLPALKHWFGKDSDIQPFRGNNPTGRQQNDRSHAGGEGYEEYTNRRGEGQRQGYGSRRYGSVEGEGEENGMSRSYGSESRRAFGGQVGKNPFGQLSSSGAFKPAGQPDSPMNEKRFNMGSERIQGSGRERRGLGQTERGTDRGVNTRRQRGGFEGGEIGEEGDMFSPEAGEKKANNAGIRSGYADSASDWRKPGQRTELPVGGAERGVRSREGYQRDRAGGLDGRMGGRERGGKPSWAEDDGAGRGKPSWMDEDGGSAPSDRRRGNTGSEEPFDLPPVSGTHVDSIQAFKAQMREKERLEREGRDWKASTSSVSGPPPGLAPPDAAPSTSPPADRKAAGQSASDAGAPASPTRNKTIAGPPPGLGAAPSSSASTSEGQSQGHPGGPALTSPVEAPAGAPGAGRSSRFARFFDSKPRDAVQAGANSASPQPQQQQQQEAKPVDFAALFGAAAPQAVPQQQPAPQGASHIQQSQPRQEVSADQASMQKLMAMLQMGPASVVPSRSHNHSNRGHDDGSNYDRQGGKPPPISPLLAQNEMGRAGGASDPSRADLQALLGGQPGSAGAPRSPHSPNDSRSGSFPPGMDMPQRGPQGSPTQRFAGQPLSPHSPFDGPQQQQQQQQHQQGGLDLRMFGQRPPPLHQQQQNISLEKLGLPHDYPGHQQYKQSPGFPTSPGVPRGGGSGAGDERNGAERSNGGGVGFGPPPSLLAGLPPHVQQQLAGLPPHVQHQILTSGRIPPGRSGSPGTGGREAGPPQHQMMSQGQGPLGSPHAPANFGVFPPHAPESPSRHREHSHHNSGGGGGGGMPASLSPIMAQFLQQQQQHGGPPPPLHHQQQGGLPPPHQQQHHQLPPQLQHLQQQPPQSPGGPPFAPPLGLSHPHAHAHGHPGMGMLPPPPGMIHFGDGGAPPNTPGGLAPGMSGAHLMALLRGGPAAAGGGGQGR